MGEIRRRGAGRGRLLAACLIVVLAVIGPSSARADTDGKVRFYKSNSPQTDRMWHEADAAGPGPQQDFLTSRYDMVRSHMPFFDRFTGWFKNSWPYVDAYAVYTGEVPGPNDQYVLLDAQGRRMYIPWGCGSDGTCPQYAADITNPAWRAAWIDEVRAGLAGGAHKGLFIDDVNFDRKVCADVGDTCDESVTPVNYQGRALTLQMWQDAMATFMEEVRAAFPAIEIAHNQVFFFAGGLSGGVPVSPEVRRAVAAADVINVERGYHDPNLDASSFAQARDWVRYAHSQRKGVVLEVNTADDPEFALATYFLDAEDGVTDYLGHQYRSLPGDWWEGWDTDLGPALQTEAYSWRGAMRRDFQNGSVVVSGPGQGSVIEGGQQAAPSDDTEQDRCLHEGTQKTCGDDWRDPSR